MAFNQDKKTSLLGTFVFALIALCAQTACGQLVPMDDETLSDVHGQIGIVLNDVEIIGSPNSSLQLTFDSNLSSDSAYIDHIALYGSDSSATCAANPSIAVCEGVDIGTFSDPITFDIVTENPSSPTYIEQKLPGKASQSGIDLQFRLLVTGRGYDEDGNGVVSAIESNNLFADVTWVNIKDLKIYDTGIKLWSSPNMPSGRQTNPLSPDNFAIPGGAAGAIGMALESTANISLGSLEVNTRNSRGFNIKNETYKAFAPFSTFDTVDKSEDSDRGAIKLSDVEITNLQTGWFPHMPLFFGSINRDGTSTNAADGCNASSECAPGFFVATPVLPNIPAVYNEFYNDIPKANVSIGAIQLGKDLSDNIFDLGSIEVRGIRVQHLRLEING